MASRKKSSWFDRIGKFVVFALAFGVFATYMGWLKTNTSVDINSNKAIEDTKHFVRRVSDKTKDVMDNK